MKKILPLMGVVIGLALTLTIVYLSQNRALMDVGLDASDKAVMDALHDDVIQFALNNDDLSLIVSYIGESDEGYYINLEIKQQDDVDYALLKQDIYEHVGETFPLHFDVVSMPSEPTTSGIIRRIDLADDDTTGTHLGTLLVVSDTERLDDTVKPNASEVSITKDTKIEDAEGRDMAFDQLKVGDKVSSYYRGVILESYPTMEGSERLVVDLDHKPRKLSDTLDSNLIERQFKRSDLYEPVPFAFEHVLTLENVHGYKYIRFSMLEGLAYHTESDAGHPVFYEGEITVTAETKEGERLEPFVFESTVLASDFAPDVVDGDVDGSIYIFIPYFVDGVWIERGFVLVDGGGVGDERLDRFFEGF